MSELRNKPTLGAFFRLKREEKGLLVRQVAAVTEMDQALVSRIENGDRLPTREQLNKLAGLYGLDLKETYSAWLAERMVRDYGSEPYAPEAFREAHDHVVMHSYRDVSKPKILFSNSHDNLSAHSGENKDSPAEPGRKPESPGDKDSRV